MIRRYESNLISFAYPENWQLTDSDQEFLPREISVESPNGALWVVHAFPPHSDAELLLAEAIATFQQNYEDFEYAKVEVEFPEPVATAVQADFFCLDFLVTARILVFTQTPLTFMVIQQAESRQFEQLGPVFDAMTTSLILSETIGESADD